MIECVKLFFGAGAFAWLAMESVILHRMFHAAPPVVATAAWLANTHGAPELLAQATWAYGVFQLLWLLRLLPWIMKQPFAPSYWAFTWRLRRLSSALVCAPGRASGNENVPL